MDVDAVAYAVEGAGGVVVELVALGFEDRTLGLVGGVAEVEGRGRRPAARPELAPVR